jgi:hypothetical protein
MRRVKVRETPGRWHWKDLELEDVVEYPTEEPKEPRAGQRWYDPQTHHLCVWDGLEWSVVPLD